MLDAEARGQDKRVAEQLCGFLYSFKKISLKEWT